MTIFVKQQGKNYLRRSILLKTFFISALYFASVTGDASVNPNPVSAAHSPFDEFCKKFNLQADFLYWKANEDGLEYGTKIIATPIGPSSKIKTKLVDLNFQWDPGFRIGGREIE